MCFFSTSQTVDRASAPFPCLKISDVSPKKTSVTPPTTPRRWPDCSPCSKSCRNLASFAESAAPWNWRRFLWRNGCTVPMEAPLGWQDDTNTPPFIPPQNKDEHENPCELNEFFAHLKASKSSGGFFKNYTSLQSSRISARSCSLGQAILHNLCKALHSHSSSTRLPEYVLFDQPVEKFGAKKNAFQDTHLLVSSSRRTPMPRKIYTGQLRWNGECPIGIHLGPQPNKKKAHIKNNAVRCLVVVAAEVRAFLHFAINGQDCRAHWSHISSFGRDFTLECNSYW